MDWTSDEEGYDIPIGLSSSHGSLKEVSPMSFTLHLSPFTRKQLYRRLQQAYGQGALRVARRFQALFALADGLSVHEGALRLGLGDQTVRDYRNALLWKGLSSLRYKRPPGRPSQLTTGQRRRKALLLFGDEASFAQWGSLS
jgi:hypothetical protein